MTTAIQVFNNPKFGNVRVIEINGEPWFVGVDVATALGYKDTYAALKQHVDDEDKLVWQITSAGQKRDATIINESGLYSLILRSNLPEAREFKHWLTAEVIPSLRKTGSYSIVQNPRPILKGDEVQIISMYAKDIESLFAVKRGIAIAQAIDVVGTNLNLKLDNLKRLLPPAEHETGYLNATQLGEKLGLKPQATNKFLAQVVWQYRDINKDWRLTELGKQYGEEMPYMRNGHSGYQIRWSESAVDVLRKEMSL